MFTPAPQIPSAAVAPIPSKNAALELTEAELKVAKKWTALYSEADKTERYALLKTKILPLLYLHNNHLPPNVWKARKSVSTR